MSNEDFVMTDAPFGEAVEALKSAGVIVEIPKAPTAAVETTFQGQYIEIGYDIKLDEDELETWVAVDETQEELTAAIFSAFQQLPYACLRTPTLSDPVERIYKPRGARKAETAAA